MERTYVEPPPIAVEEGIKGGFWLQCAGHGAKAIVYWFGGPKSPDRDVILFDINADVPGMGHGTLLVHEILAWCDSAGLTISADAPPERVEWLRRLGFVPVGQGFMGTVMGRSPVPVLSN